MKWRSVDHDLWRGTCPGYHAEAWTDGDGRWEWALWRRDQRVTYAGYPLGRAMARGIATNLRDCKAAVKEAISC